MKLGWIAIFVCLAAASPASAAPVIHRLDGRVLTAQEADRIADRTLAANGVMGAELAILDHGRLVWTHAYGLRDAGQALPMTPDTNIWAASITKGAFATWVMLQAERGRIDLDQPVAQILTKPLDQYDNYRVSAAKLVRDPAWARVTPRMLLSHTSGLANFVALEPDKALRLHFAPGSRFAYSGDGLNILQLALEEKLGASLEVLMDRDLFAPLGMAHTSMVWREAFRPDNALRYDAHGGLIGATRRDQARGAGSMATSVSDLARFTQALMAGRIVAPPTLARMLTPQIAINARQQFPTLDTATSGEGPKVGLAYGLGWGLLTRTPDGPAFFKEGHGDGAENYMICFTRRGLCLLILTNSDNGELAFKPLLEALIADRVTPWTWESYERAQVLGNEEHKGVMRAAR